MTSVAVIPCEDAEAWDGALAGIAHGFHHTSEYARAIELSTGHSAFLLTLETGGRRLVCPMVEREIDGHLDVATPSGLSGFAGDAQWTLFEPDWAAFVRDRGYVSAYIGLHPLFAPADLLRELPAHNNVFVLDLGLGPEELLRRMDRNRRRELRGWDERAGQLVHDRQALGRFLASEYEPFMRAVGARPPLLAPEALDLLCRSEQCLVVGAESAGDVSAVYVFGFAAHGGECLINVATDEGRRRSTDLLWYGVCELSGRGIASLNLGGGARDGDAVARAKQRFRPRRLGLRALREVLRPDAYAELCSSAGVDASDQGFFPAYRAPRAERLESGSR